MNRRLRRLDDWAMDHVTLIAWLGLGCSLASIVLIVIAALMS